MPKEIDCFNCEGDGYTAEHDPNDPHENGMCTDCPIQVQCEDCNGTGKITVYTQEEVNQKIGYVEGLYTPEELNKAVSEWKDKLYSFLQGLEIQNIPKFLEEAELANYQMLSEMVKLKINKAIQENNEECAKVCDNLLTLYNSNILAVAGVEGAFEMTAEEIRNRKGV